MAELTVLFTIATLILIVAWTIIPFYIIGLSKKTEKIYKSLIMIEESLNNINKKLKNLNDKNSVD